MRLVRFLDPRGRTTFGARQTDGSVHRLVESPFGSEPPPEHRLEDDPVEVERLLAPVDPPAVLGIGLNYRRHAEESGATVPDYPVLFTKPSTSVLPPGESVELPRHLRSEKVDYECELAVVIGERCKNVSPDEVYDHVLGYTCANDVSARDWQLERGGGQWTRGKSFDTFSPLGPAVVTTDEITDPHELAIRTRLNGETVQDWTTSDMIFEVPEIVSFLSGSTTLLPGTVILTGTPHGVGMAQDPPRWLKPGDEVTVEIEGIGALTNSVRAESS